MILVMILGQNELSAQVQSTNVVPVNTSLRSEVVSDTLNKTVLVKENPSTSNQLGEPTLTPEQQGYTKLNENGEVIYKKVTESLIIEYKPKN